MFCLLIAFIARLRRGFGIISRNSRFRGINSRLGLQKFPVRLLREFGRKRLILLAVLGTKSALSEENAKNSQFYGKNREWSGAEMRRPSDGEVLGLRVVDDDRG